jgi:uncharacterized protein YndB with AHSA1/START domain
MLEGPDGSAATAACEWQERSRSAAARRAVIRVACPYRASSARVFDAWLDPEVARKWLFATASYPLAHVEIDARVEGSFRFVDRRDGDIAEYTGEYLEIIPHRRLVFTLASGKYPRGDTRVTVEIASRTNSCELTLIHENVPPNCAERMEGRWTGILYGLGVTLAGPSPGSTTIGS